MSDRWIMDVLADLRSFAETNDYNLLVQCLKEAELTAALELANKSPRRKQEPMGPAFATSRGAAH